MAGEIDWEVFAEHLRAQGEEHLLDEYPEYAEWRRRQAGKKEVPAPAEEAPAVERVVERIVEVLVIRCKHCQELSPVERETCKACGKAEFY